MKFKEINKTIFLWIFFSLGTLFAEPINKKILIMTSTTNHADFIEIQNKTFEKFLKEDYEFVVFNDACDPHESKEIFDTCLLLNIKCIQVPQENRGTPDWLIRKFPIFVKEHPWWACAAFRHDQAISYMMQTDGFKYDGVVVLIDSDMFLTDFFSVIDFLGDHDISGLKLGYEPDRIHFWPGLMFFRMDKLPNKETMKFAPVMTESLTLNTGGSLYHYLEANQNLKKLFFEQKGRLLLDQHWNPFYVMAANNHHYAQCNLCSGSQIKCPHNIQILKELGFRMKMLDLIEQKKCPENCEFVLNDIFLHFRGVSNTPNYPHHDDRAYELDEKLKRFYILMDNILGSNTESTY